MAPAKKHLSEKSLKINQLKPTKSKSSNQITDKEIRCETPTQVTIKCVEHTVAWLQSHHQEQKVSSSFIQSLLHWFHDRPENDATPPLPLAWGQDKLGFSWEEQSFGILNAPLYADMKQARRIIRSGRLNQATDAHRADFAKWFAEFLDQLSLCDRLKQRLLFEKAHLSNTSTHVKTQYDRVQTIYEESLKAQSDDITTYCNKLLQCLDEVDAVLTDEELAIRDANVATSNPTLENAAFSVVFSRMRANDAAGVYIAKLVAWMRSTLSRDDFNAFFKLLSASLKECLARNWKEYATHLHRLEPFAVDQPCCIDYVRSRAEIVSSPTNAASH